MHLGRARLLALQHPDERCGIATSNLPKLHAI
jgi:hypothetical protein